MDEKLVSCSMLLVGLAEKWRTYGIAAQAAQERKDAAQQLERAPSHPAPAARDEGADAA